MKLAVFDFDSTLMDGETLEFLGKEFGIDERIKLITDRAMRGEIDFFESLKERVLLLKGLSVSKVDEICHSLPIMNGAKEAIYGMKSLGYKVICFSGGFTNATKYFMKKLDLDAEFANILHSKNGLLTGDVGGNMMFNDSKGQMLLKLQSLMNITPSETIAIGDGANDLSMFQYAKTRIAFCAKPVLKNAANIIIEEKDLSKILDYVQ